MLELINCRKSILDGSLNRLLFDIPYLKINKGQLHLCLGPSGSGKTSLLEVCCGLSSVDSGEVLWCGSPVKSVADFNGQACYVPVDACLFNELSILDNMAFVMKMKGHRVNKENVIAMLEAVGLSYLNPNDSPVMCSMGEKIRLSLCRALLQAPQLLLIDEPTANLDYETSKEIFGLIKSQSQQMGMAVLLSSHDKQAIEFVDQETRFS